MAGEPRLGSTPWRQMTSRALSRNTSVDSITSGASAPMAKPAACARSTSLPDTASIHMPCSRMAPSTLAAEHAFMA